MKTVEELRGMLNNVRGTIEDFKDFEATTEKIVEAKMIFKMEKVQEIFRKYQGIIEEVSKVPSGINIMNYFEWYVFKDSDYYLVIAKDNETNSIVPLIKSRNYTYLIRFEANSKFNESILNKVQKYYSTTKLSTTTITKATAKNLIIPLDLSKLEEQIVKTIENVLNMINESYKRQKEKIIKNLEGLKDIPFINLNKITDLSIGYIYTIKDCLEGVRKFRLAGLIGFEEITENDFYEQIDEVLEKFIIPLSEKGNDVKIIEEEV